ncbi:MAG: EamA family transporter [Oscillospiraceae bacterium]|nr:EamA family transporter [Oscillospiraceae bacterium]
MSYVFVLITAILFTTHEPVSKLIANEINPYAITAIRYFLGSLVCLPFSIREIIKNKLNLKFKDFLILGGLGVLTVCISMVLVQVGVKVADSPALISVLFSSNSIFTIIFSVIFLKIKMTKIKTAGVILCVTGVVLSMDLTSGSNALSIVFGLLSAITFSIYTVLCQKFIHRFSGIIQAGISFFIGSSVLLIFLWIFGIDIIGGISADNLPELAYISIAVTGIGYILYFSALSKSGPHVAALTFLIKPILVPFVAWIVNGIVPDYTIIIAVILVAIGATFSGGAFESFIMNNKNKKLN